MLLDRDIITVHASAGVKNYLRLMLSTDSGKTTEFRVDPTSSNLTFTVAPEGFSMEGPEGLLSALMQAKKAHINADFPDDFDSAGSEQNKITDGKITIQIDLVEFVQSDNVGIPGKTVELSSLLITIGREGHELFEPGNGSIAVWNPATIPLVIDDVLYTNMNDFTWFFLSRDRIKMTPYSHDKDGTLTRLVLETDE